MKLLLGERLPVQIRTFVPDAHSCADFNERHHLVSSVRVTEMGPDALIVVYGRGMGTAFGQLRVLARDTEPLLQRLFHDAPAAETPREDRETFQKLMDDFEDAIVAKDAAARTLVRRRLLACLDSMAADLATIGAQ